MMGTETSKATTTTAAAWKGTTEQRARRLWAAALFSVALAAAILLATADAAYAAPPAPSITAPSEGSYNNGAFILEGTAPANATLHIRDAINDKYLGSVSVDSSRTWWFVLGGVSEGKHAYKARVWKNGGFSAWSNIRTVTVDTTAPAAPSFTSSWDGKYLLSQCTTIRFYGTTEPGSTVDLFEDTVTGLTQKGTVQADSSGNWSLQVDNIGCPSPKTLYNFKARATDLAGNVSGWSDPLTIEAVDHRGENH